MRLRSERVIEGAVVLADEIRQYFVDHPGVR